jgi:recombination protein RecT
MPEQSTKLAPKNPVLAMIESRKENLMARLPQGMDKSKFFLGIMTAINRSKANAQPGKSLAECDPNSVLLAAFEAAEVGCPLNPSLQLGWLIPYGKEAQFQPSYRFFIQKAYETGDVRAFFAEVTYEGDRLDRQYAPKKNLFHAPGDDNERNRETASGAYALIEFNDGQLDWEYLTAEQVDRHRKHSKQPNSLMWGTFWEEGWRKTPIRVLAKRLPLKSRKLEDLVELVNKDAEADLVIPPDDVVEIPPPRRTEAEPEAENREADRPKEKAEEATTQTQKTGHGSPAEAEKPKAKEKPAQEQEADPLLSAEEQQEIWKFVFGKSISKLDVKKILKQEFNVEDLKDVRRSQRKKLEELINAKF